MTAVVAEFRYGAGAAGEATVAVCTYRRPASVVAFLKAAEANEPGEFPFLIVDASPDGDTEQAIRAYWTSKRHSTSLSYFRLKASGRGLTRQRNFALSRVTTELVAFFDDDIEFVTPCVSEMVRCYRAAGCQAAGVGALIVNELRKPTLLWRIRYLVRIVSGLTPGSYHASGFSIPWSFLSKPDGVIEGDWLPGGAALWRTEAARATGFQEDFSTYGQGEDLEFSLRIRRHGKLLLCSAARVVHLHASEGRENEYRLGYMAIYNRYRIHQLLDRRRRAQVAWFVYAWLLDTVTLFFGLRSFREVKELIQHVGGRLTAAYDLLSGRPNRLREPPQQERAAGWTG